MAKEYGVLHGEMPAVLVAIEANTLANGLKRRLGDMQYSVFGANVKKVFANITPEDEVKVLIRMIHTAIAPGEEPVIDYIGTLDKVWLTSSVKGRNKQFYEQFTEAFKAKWVQVMAESDKKQELMPVYYGVKSIRYLRSPIRISELRSWSAGTFYSPKFRITRPIRVIWEHNFLERIGA